MTKGRPTLVAGVFPGQPDAVAEEAIRLAERFGAHVHFVQVNQTRYPVDAAPDGDPPARRSLPVDADSVGDEPDEFDPGLARRIALQVGDRPVPWSSHIEAGEPAAALARVAERVDAELIIVGTRGSTTRETLRELINGSVAMRLAHRQHRAVVVVPLAPLLLDEDDPPPS